MKVVLISGKAENGKDSVANFLKLWLSNMGYKVIRLAFGDYVKDTARIILDWNGEKDESGRALLQWWGTEYVRAKSPDFWMETVVRLAKVIKDDTDFLLVPDVRFPNEIIGFKEDRLDVLTVRVNRPGHISRLTPEQLKHYSETALDTWPFNVYLTATNMDELQVEVKNKLMPILIEKGK